MARGLEALRAVASLFYPASCAVCGTAVEESMHLCEKCAARAPRISAPFCARCSEPFCGAIENQFVCANCAHRDLQFEAAVSAYRSRSVVRLVLLQFKYNRQLHLRHVITGWLLEALTDARLHERVFDAIVPVPLHPARVRERGFNQAEVLARELARHTGLPVLRALERTRYTSTQTLLDRADRMRNLRNAFRLRKNVSVRDCRVLLLDDVLTTGSTLSECAGVLRRQGACSIFALTAARA